MNKILEIKNNVGDIVISTNENELIIGRDCLLNCQDKRISREHACVKCVDGNFFILSLHSNPLFYKAKSTDNIVVITKDIEIPVNNDDKISMIPNHDSEESWLYINIVEGENNNNTNKRKLPSWLNDNNITKKSKNTDPSATSDISTSTSDINLNEEPTNSAIIKQEPSDDVGESSSIEILAQGSLNTNTDQPPTNEMPLIVPKKEVNNDSVESTSAEQASTSNSSVSADIKNVVKKEEPDSSSSNLRDSCTYGVKCYRRNPMHRTELAHPGDDDYRRPYFPDPASDAPDCAFGARCYRRNPVHFQQFKHPSSTFANNNTNVRKRRRNVITYNEDGSENDYDYDDPFINDDSSDDYVPSDSEEEDDNSEHEISQVEI